MAHDITPDAQAFVDQCEQLGYYGVPLPTRPTRIRLRLTYGLRAAIHALLRPRKTEE